MFNKNDMLISSPSGMMIEERFLVQETKTKTNQPTKLSPQSDFHLEMAIEV